MALDVTPRQRPLQDLDAPIDEVVWRIELESRLSLYGLLRRNFNMGPVQISLSIGLSR